MFINVLFYWKGKCLNFCYGLLLFFRYLNNHLMNLFAGAWEPRDVSPLPVDIPHATDEQVRRLLLTLKGCVVRSVLTQRDLNVLFVNVNQVQSCIELVSRAKKPVILLGSQATLPPTPADDIRYATA